MEIKFYKGDKLLAVSNALPEGSGERDRQIIAMANMVEDKWNQYTVDRERSICNKIDNHKRMYYAKNIELNRKYFSDGVIFYRGFFLDLMETKKRKPFIHMLGQEIICPVCKKELIVDWYGIYHACYNSEAETQYSIDYDLYELFHLGKANEQFWKEINDCNV